ncbi:MAG: hypothetical protein KME06_11130 [Kastovskya adunca ATA6-11-RM4]|jgi:hypothetical protein|nr:hypothetical protein [Kastovskya adunca ATA6-11-RM4]
MNLLPVVEFAPTYYQTKHHAMPECSKWNCCDDWDAYWKNSLADSGIISLEPYAKGLWLVETEELLNHNKAIELMLQKHLIDSKGNIKEDFSALYGGYILEINETFQIYPECCGSLKDIHEWKDISKWTDSQETMLWIGHPWLMVSAIEEEYLQFRRTAEYGEPPKPVIFKVKRSDLKLAVAGAEEKLFNFQQFLLPILRKIM